MAHPQTPMSGHESVPLEDASTQTTDRNSFILVNTRDASTQTSVEEFISPEKTLDASTQTTEVYSSVLQQPPATLETSEESRKRRISKVQEMQHGSDVGKLPRTETSIMGDEFLSSLNVLPVYSDNTKNINTQGNVASNKNISQKENAPREKSDTDVFKVTNVSFFDDMLAVPGPSRCLEDEFHSNPSVEKLQKESPLKQQPSVHTKQKEPTCLACKQTASKHVEYHLNDEYKCCRCIYTYSTFNYLQMHIYNEHTKPYHCNVCRMKYSDVASHVLGGPCALCHKYFSCKFELEEHYISAHKAFLETHCRMCKRKFDEHLTAGVILRDKYECCVAECKIRSNSASSLNQHLGSHSPLKLSKCDVCGLHFKQLQDHKFKTHPLCNSCGKRFVNIYFLSLHLCEKRKEE